MPRTHHIARSAAVAATSAPTRTNPATSPRRSSPKTRHLPQESRIVRPFENHAPQFRRVLHQFHVAFDVNVSLQSRNEIKQVNLLNDILGTQCAPRFLQRRCRLQMPRPRRHRRDKNAHVELAGGLPRHNHREQEISPPERRRRISAGEPIIASQSSTAPPLAQNRPSGAGSPASSAAVRCGRKRPAPGSSAV